MPFPTRLVILFAALSQIIMTRFVMGTSIAIIRTEHLIVIAADSAAVDELGRRATTAECKIRPIGRFYYVPNKFTEDSAGGYNVHRIIENVGTRDSLGSLATALRDAIPGPLVRALMGARQRNPVRFKENFETKQAMGVALAGIDGGRPTLIDMRFYIEDLDAKTISLRLEEHRCPEGDRSDGVATVLIGPQWLQQRFAAEHPNYWTGNLDNISENAEAFVKMAIDAGLPDVAPPISVLVIGPSAIDWRRPGSCAAGTPRK